jgi:hypothetical protein
MICGRVLVLSLPLRTGHGGGSGLQKWPCNLSASAWSRRVAIGCGAAASLALTAGPCESQALGAIDVVGDILFQYNQKGS